MSSDGSWIAGWGDLGGPANTQSFIVHISPSLTASADHFSASAGGQIDFTLDAGTDNASRNYILLGSVSGTDPGTPLPGGLVVLPLNWDLFTTLMIENLGTSVFPGFLGALDGSGMAKATLNAGPGVGLAGITMHFAFALNAPWDFVSNPVAVDIVP